MRKKPVSLNLLTTFLLACAIGLPFQIVLQEGHHLFYEFPQIWHKLTDLNILIMGLMLVTAYTSFTGHHYLKRMAALTIGFVCLNNFYLSAQGATPYFITTAASLGFTIPTLILSFSAVQTILDHQDLRWWRIPTRTQRQFPVDLKNQEGKPLIRGNTHDLSSGGLFITLPAEECTKLIQNLPQKAPRTPEGKHKFFLTTTVADEKGKQNDIKLQAEIVRINEKEKGLYPSGLGLKIVGGKWKEKFQWNMLQKKCQWGWI